MVTEEDKIIYGAILQVIIDTQAILSTEEKWTQGSDAKTVLGQPVKATDPCAVCWCLGGALRNAEERILFLSYLEKVDFSLSGLYWSTRTVIERAIHEIDACGPYSISEFNDNRTYPDVMAVLERASKDVLERLVEEGEYGSV